MDDYTAWVTGPSAEANYIGIQQIVEKAVQWEKRSGATFETAKTVFVGTLYKGNTSVMLCSNSI